MRNIYLDYAATTPVHKAVANMMWEYITVEGEFANSTSQHAAGKRAQAAISTAREQVAAAINAEASEIIWTSGATEANNLAIKGMATLYQNKGKHIITMKTEHKSVLDTCMHLEKEGFRVTYLSPEPNGMLSLDNLKAAFCDDTLLVSIMAVNNETGIIQNLAAIRDLTHERGILFHTDAVQAMGKINIDVKQTPIDALSLTAHKAYGPKGIGALYLRKRPRIRVAPLIHGGGQENGMRSGTLATHQIVGMGAALAMAHQEIEKNIAHINTLRQTFLRELMQISTVKLNVDENNTVPHIANIQFSGSIADALLNALPYLAASTASACQEKSGSGSHVLRAIGLSAEQIKASIRFSFGLYLKLEEVKTAAQMFKSLFNIKK